MKRPIWILIATAVPFLSAHAQLEGAVGPDTAAAAAAAGQAQRPPVGGGSARTSTPPASNPSESSGSATTAPSTSTSTRTAETPTQPAEGVAAGTETTPVDPASTSSPAVTETKLRDLSQAEIKELFSGFSLSKQGSDPQASVTLRGVGYKSCISDASKLKVTHSASDPALSGSGMKGFRVQMSLDAIDCTRKLKTSGVKCEDAPQGCLRLSSVEGTRLDLNLVGDGKIAFFREPVGEDVEGFLSEVAVPEISFKSAETLAADAQRLLDEEKKSKLDLDAKIMKNCRGSKEELAHALDALTRLRDAGALKEGSFDKIKKELDKKELDLLVAALRKAPLMKDEDELSAVLAFGDGREEYHDAIKDAYFERIKRYYDNGLKQSDLASIEKARQLTEEARDSLTLKEEDQTKLTTYLERDLILAASQVKASGGWTNNMDLQADVQNQMQALQQQMSIACSYQAADLGGGRMGPAVRDPDGCRAAFSQRDRLMSIVKTAQEIERNRFANMSSQNQTGPAAAPGATQPQMGAPNPYAQAPGAGLGGFGQNSVAPQRSSILMNGFNPGYSTPSNAWGANSGYNYSPMGRSPAIAY